MCGSKCTACIPQLLIWTKPLLPRAHGLSAAQLLHRQHETRFGVAPSILILAPSGLKGREPLRRAAGGTRWTGSARAASRRAATTASVTTAPTAYPPRARAKAPCMLAAFKAQQWPQPAPELPLMPAQLQAAGAPASTGPPLSCTHPGRRAAAMPAQLQAAGAPASTGPPLSCTHPGRRAAAMPAQLAASCTSCCLMSAWVRRCRPSGPRCAAAPCPRPVGRGAQPPPAVGAAVRPRVGCLI